MSGEVHRMVTREGVTVSRRAVIGAITTCVAGSLMIASRPGMGQTPVASPAAATPCASPVASPAASMASPVASPIVGCDGDLTIVAVDLAFEPAVITIDVGVPVKIRIRNGGVLQHDFAIDQLGIATPLIDPGKSATVSIEAAPGSYPFRCTVAGHAEAGMTGTLTVNAS